MKPLWRYSLLTLSLLVLPGCGDTPHTLVRTVRNTKNELMDRLMKVDDEAAAKKFESAIVKVRDDHVKKLDDKYAEVTKNIIDDDEVVKPKSLDKQIKEMKKQIGEMRKQADFGRNEELQTQVADLEKRVADAEKKLKDFYRDLFGELADVIIADDERFAREKARIEGLVKQFKEENVPCPTLQKLTERKTYDGTMMTLPLAPGLDKKQFMENVLEEKKKPKEN